MIRRIFSVLAIAFFAVAAFVTLPTSARAEAWFPQDATPQTNQAFQYAQADTYTPNNDQYTQGNDRNSPNNDQQAQDQRASGHQTQGFRFFNNQSNQEKGQNQKQNGQQQTQSSASSSDQ